ncbi:unnamed protein product [Lampetra fluviatilis]
MAAEREPPPLFDDDEEEEKTRGGEDDDEEEEEGDEQEQDDGADIFTSVLSNPEVSWNLISPFSPPEPASLLSEESSSKSNGLQAQSLDTSPEDDPDDLFAEATEEVSLESPVNRISVAANPGPTVKPSRGDMASSFKPDAITPSPVPAASKLVSFQRTRDEIEEEESGDTFDFRITITNPEKVGDGMNAYMAYNVTTTTSLPMFKRKEFTVKRRFSDFLGLYEKLTEKFSHSGFIVPPAPEKSVLGMTKVKVGKDDPSSVEFVERRRAALERYLQRTSKHPTLMQDPDFRDFLERDELPRAVNTQALSGAGILRMVTKAADAVNKMTIKMNESDSWFEEKQLEFENLETQLRKLHGNFEGLVNHRKEMSLNTAAFAKSAAMLGNSEDNTALSRALSQLAEVEEKIDALHQEQANADLYVFAELLADYIRLLTSIRGVFDQRAKSWQRWQDAQANLHKKRENEAKLQWANKPDKLQQAKDEIREWDAKVQQGESEFEIVSKTIRKEVMRFEKERVRDFKNGIVRYIESLINTQQQLIKYWEAFLPEAKAIA